MKPLLSLLLLVLLITPAWGQDSIDCHGRIYEIDSCTLANIMERLNHEGEIIESARTFNESMGKRIENIIRIIEDGRRISDSMNADWDEQEAREDRIALYIVVALILVAIILTIKYWRKL